ncbi:MAG: YihY/virulence factor BrkB family protein [Paracoccus denitrificans]|nr:MAG: YihY/virulence factor BrkB family protein [Paracoccus denitrificans]PZO85612.1 MAG: YihY/virulence factor BrkB family protein [Paracoccus denitrificans]
MIEQLKDFWNFTVAVMERMDKIHMGLIAAGVAFYAMFAIFPGLAAIIALWGLWFDPTLIQEYYRVLDEFAPHQASEILHTQIDAMTSTGRTQLGWTSFISFMVATISARAGVNALVRGLNAAHGVRSHATIFGWFLAYGLTLAIMATTFIGLAMIIVVPIALNFIDLGPLQGWLTGNVPWVAMFAIVVTGIGIIYRYGPNVETPRTPLFTWGAVFAALAWGAASLAFSAYLAQFNSYNRIYGSIGAVIALLMWFYLAGFSVMLGAVLNVEIARRRRLSAARRARELARSMATARTTAPKG